MLFLSSTKVNFFSGKIFLSGGIKNFEKKNFGDLVPKSLRIDHYIFNNHIK
jgi:hypothetical protein